MKKGKIFTGMLALLAAAATVIAFKTNHTPPVDLYYYNSDSVCMAAPCETFNHTNKVCLTIVYSDSNCRSEYKGTIWVKNSDR